jgi:hypothetical protein
MRKLLKELCGKGGSYLNTQINLLQAIIACSFDVRILSPREKQGIKVFNIGLYSESTEAFKIVPLLLITVGW